MKNKIYLFFDQIPDANSGGLIAMYKNFVDIMKDTYDITIVSIFECNEKNKEILGCKNIILSSFNIDNRFFKAFSYLKNKEIFKFFRGILSAIYFFMYIPFARLKTRKIFLGADDILIASSPAAAIFLSNKLKFILEVHTSFDYFWGSNLLGRMQSLLIAKPSLVLFRNQYDASKGINLFNSTYIYNFFNDSLLGDNHIHSFHKKNEIIFLGRLHESKNPIRLLQCAKILKDRNVDFKLDIYGTGDLEDFLKQEIVNFGLCDYVYMKGYVDDKKIYDKYKVIWLTSDYEGFGLVIVEGKANYVPTISTNWGPGVYEVIEDGKDGFIVNSNEELVQKTLELLTNDALLENMSLCARENYEKKFSKDVYKRTWNEILEKY